MLFYTHPLSKAEDKNAPVFLCISQGVVVILLSQYKIKTISVYICLYKVYITVYIAFQQAVATSKGLNPEGHTNIPCYLQQV